MITLDAAIKRVTRMLGDEEEEVWTRAQVSGFIFDGYDMLVRETVCLFDMFMFDSHPLAGNHTRQWEEQYMTGMPILAIFNFTSEAEREFADPGEVGPINHTRPSDAAYMGDISPSAMPLGKLPDTIVEVSRVTHDWLRLAPEWSRALRASRIEYETLQGGVFAYSMDQDGVFSIRRVGVPIPIVSSEEISGIYGPVRRITSYGMDTETVVGSYGIIRSVPRHFASGGQYGAMRRMVPDDNATRIEYFRLGKNLEGNGFEIPDRFVRYVEYWALYRAYTTTGPGEDMALGQHFKQRYEMGAKRLKDRVSAIMDERTIAMGAKRQSIRDNYLERFPGDMGYPRPFGR